MGNTAVFCLVLPLWVFLILCAIPVFLIFIICRMTWYYIVSCWNKRFGDDCCMNACGANDTYCTAATDLKSTFETLFGECKDRILACHHRCLGYQVMWDVFKTMSVYVVLVTVVALGYLLSPVVFVSLGVGLVVVVIGVSCRLNCFSFRCCLRVSQILCCDDYAEDDSDSAGTKS